ncbi:hypothetical protein BRM21_07650 [Xanthomonas oryzae pv. oryzae]|nr:hypothetical protein B9W05_19240 [Xanthomonas oryzae pv. oryzae]AXI16040.1 hypothetical protein CDO19_00680 [Xanthomonas oryzae pv. oryzae]AXI19991.1 hypothetical protein CDO11_00675 [Xanthomonas oryzae pv. oryzae]AXM08240.1 hypothetical protein BRM60_00680 [Xanthomonas oryzae pv. oryzae]AXM15757.1 hypothetical protein BRN66_00690 [Xanthomonas oryzae pv. oryzae]
MWRLRGMLAGIFDRHMPGCLSSAMHEAIAVARSGGCTRIRVMSVQAATLRAASRAATWHR